MALHLNHSQRDYLQSQPTPDGHPNKIRLALRIVGANQRVLADTTGIANQQLGRYLSGRDLMLSTAGIIATVLGVAVSDLWPVAPAAKAKRRKKNGATASTSRRRPRTPRKPSKAGPRSESVAA